MQQEDIKGEGAVHSKFALFPGDARFQNEKVSVSREKICPSTPRVRGRIRPQRPCVERITEEAVSSYLAT